MPGERTDLGFSAAAVLIAALLYLWARRRWRLAALRRKEVERLAWFAAQESARIEAESLAYAVSPPPPPTPIPTTELYSDVGGAKPPVIASTPATKVLPPECAVCFRHTTSRCKRCKAVRYCSGKCQIIHWRQGHKDECHPPRIDDRYSGSESSYNLKGSLTDEPAISENNMDIKTNAQPKPAEKSSSRSSLESDLPSIASSEGDSSVKPYVYIFGTESSSNSFVHSSSSSSSLSSSSSSSSSSTSSPFSVPMDKSGDASAGDDLHSGNLEKNSLDGISPESPIIAVNNSEKNLEKDQHGSPNFSVDTSPSTSNFKKVSKNKVEDVECSSSGLSEPSFVILESRKIDRPLHNAGESEDDCVLNAGSSIIVSSNALPSEVRPANKDLSNREAESDRVASSESTGQSNHWCSATSSSVANVKNADVWLLKSKGSVPVSSFTSGESESVSSGGKHNVSCDTSSKKVSGPVLLNKSSVTIVSASNGINDLKTSVRRVVQQLKPSHTSKHHQSGPRNDISQKYKMLFPYELFVKLYNCDKVELRPCGLTNCGNSCYANAVLQCLAFTRPLTSYLLQGHHSKICSKMDWCFTCEFASLLVKARQGQSPLSPIGILSHIHSIGSNLGPGRQEDAHEFLRYAIDTMQSVCLKEAGENAVGKLAEETTLIQLIFGGYLRSKIKCTKCRVTSERHERMMDLTVEIHGDIGKLEDALARFTATEILDGENRYQCNRCKSYERAKKKLTVLEAPNILTIALKRFQSGKFGKINKAVRFPAILDLAPYMSGTDKSAVYTLYAVVVHQDIMNAAFSGHYVCYVKNTQGKWYKTDDSKVKPVDVGRVLAENAYMLLYARCSPRAPSLIRTSMPLDHLKSNKRNQRSSTQQRSHHDLPPYGFFRSSLDDFNERLPFPRTDSSSDNSSLLSCSDEGSTSTESTRDSTSTEEYSEYRFGDSGRFSSSVFSDDSNRCFDGDGEFVCYGRDDPTILYSDTSNQCRKLTGESSRGRESDRGGFAGLSEMTSRSSTRERRTQTFY